MALIKHIGGRYSHQKLSGPGMIRIVVLHTSDSFDDPLICDIEETKLQPPGRFRLPLVDSSYTALSYAWGRNEDGDSARTHKLVVLDGGKEYRQLDITQNLRDALRRIRQRTAHFRVPGGRVYVERLNSTRLWVDAVCIDQGNLEERGDQVAIMDRIYRSAAKVVVWLGEGNSMADDRDALAMLACFSSGWGAHDESHHVFQIPQLGEAKLCSFIKSRKLHHHVLRGSISHDGGLLAEGLHVMRIFRGLASRRYFSRRWIVQELYSGNSEHVTVQWGSVQCHLDVFRRGWNAASDFVEYGFVHARQGDSQYTPEIIAMSQGLDKTMQGVLRVVSICTATSGTISKYFGLTDPNEPNFFGWKEQILPQTLKEFSKLECADPRDILYAFNSLDDEFDLLPDYTMTTAEVYTKFARLLVSKGMINSILVNLRRYTPVTTHPVIDLLSWVPDLRRGYNRPAYEDGEGHNARVSVSGRALSFTAGVLGKLKTPNGGSHHIVDSDNRDLYLRAHEKTADGRALGASLLRKGDMVCLYPGFTSEFGAFDELIVLRESRNNADCHGIITTFPAGDFLQVTGISGKTEVRSRPPHKLKRQRLTIL